VPARPDATPARRHALPGCRPGRESIGLPRPLR